MTGRQPPDSPIETAARATGPRVTQAFELLGDETRLAILLAIWEAIDEAGEGATPLSFSELRERVGVSDSGQFNYHLKQLVGTFVEDTNEGYLLKNAGHAIIEPVIAGAGIKDVSLEPTEIDVSCPLCGAPTAVGYQNELIYQVCTNCEGDHEKMGSLADLSDEFGGLIFVAVFAPAGLADRTPKELYETGVVKVQLRGAIQMLGICSRCSGTVTASLHFCDGHVGSGDEICPNCGHRWGFRPMFTCTVCKYESVPHPSFPVGFHPAVIDFYADHGIKIGDLTDPESIVRMERLLRDQSAELVSRNPPRVRVTIRHDGDELQLTYDDEVDFIDVSEGT